MKHLQKIKNVYVKVFYAGNGHFKRMETFNCALEAKRYVETMAKISKPELLFIISDDYNTLYQGNGRKV